jgi:hypothetical protein
MGGVVMGILLDLSFQYFDLFLFAVLICLVTFILSLMIKNRKTLIIVMGVLIIGTIIFIWQMKYTTFLELYSDHLNEDSAVKSVSITINDLSSNMQANIRTVTIEDEEIIDRILEDLSSLELKKDDGVQHRFRDYHIKMVVTNQIEEDHFSTDVIHFDLDKNYINDYRIINETNHLKTIDSLIEEKEPF